MPFQLTILGSNSALPTANRFSTAQVLNVRERFFLIDCAEGTQIQLRRYKIRLGKINHIFISHLHGDHYFGLFGLISTFNLLKRTNPLHIFAHPNLKKILKCQFQFTENPCFEVVFHPIKPENKTIIYENDKVSVWAFPLKHRIHTSGFLFREKQEPLNIKKDMIRKYKIPIRDIVRIKEGADFIDSRGNTIPNRDLTLPPYNPRTYSFCSDTAYDESIIPVIDNCDLLYHEATFLHEKEKEAELTHHSTSKQAARIAFKANAGKLIIGHFSARYKDIRKNLDEAKSVFHNTDVAEDGKVFKVDRKRENEDY